MDKPCCYALWAGPLTFNWDNRVRPRMSFRWHGRAGACLFLGRFSVALWSPTILRSYTKAGWRASA